MSAPIIGITSSHTLSSTNIPMSSVPEAYSTAILRAGGIPLLLPNRIKPADLPRLRDFLDGILFSGGGDIQPKIFNGTPHTRVSEVDIDRDEMEFELVHLAAETGWPFLGICRGIQVINVALGGSLYTDITAQLPGALRHDCYPNMPRDYAAHKVSIQPGSIMEEIISGSELQVNSLHHQGIQRLAGDLDILANAPDGLVEAVQLKNHPFGLAVQWHPEWLPGSPANQAIFSAFVEAMQ